MSDGLSPQDLKDLAQIRGALPAGDPRIAKIDTLLTPARPAGLPAGVNLPGVPQGNQPVNMPLAQMEGLDNGMALIHGAVGAAKSIPQTIAGVAKMRNSIPRPLRMLTGDVAPNTPDSAIASIAAAGKPDGTAETVGQGIGDAAQFMAIPEIGASALPRIGAQAITTGLLNKAQGGTFTAGAAAGGVGGAIGEGLRAVAPKIAQFAMGTNRVERSLGKNPGLSVLEDTEGVRPSTVVQSAGNKISSLGKQRDTITDAFDASGGRVSVQPGIDVVDDALGRGIATNSKGVSLPQLENVRSNLTTSPMIDSATGGFTSPGNPNAISGVPLSPTQSARGAQNMKIGLRNDYISNFDPVMMKGTRSVANQAAGAVDGSLDSALGPEYKSLNDRMSGLYAVQDAMTRRELAPSFLEKTGGRIAAHTGAATMGTAGTFEGYREGGLPGAIAGGVAGIALPELLTSPETQMVLARSAFAPATRQITLPAIKAAGLQFLPRSQ